MKPWLASLLIAIAATGAVLASLGPLGDGPGVTCDELYHVGLMGKPLVAAVRHQGIGFFTPENVRRNFVWPEGGPPVQAPLGHWILGLTHHLFDPSPDNPAVISIAAARFAPALAFGLLVFLVGHWTWRRAGPLAGMVAGASVALMPRVFAHAHFAALDMMTTTACAGALFALTWAARTDDVRSCPGARHTWIRFALAGIVWGMAMLIRLHGVTLLPPVALWLLWRSGVFRFLRHASQSSAASAPFHPSWPLVWFSAGVITLMLGWPWLWLNPVENLWRYVASGSVRQAVHVFYLGQVWADHQTPWHYPILMFVWTVPLGFLLLGLCGVTSRLQSIRREGTGGGACVNGDFALVALVGGFWLVVFAWPGIPVYDGVRLLLLVFPLAAVFAGLGAAWLAELAVVERVPRQIRIGLIGLLVLSQAAGVVLYHPYQLSYYNLLAGGLPGAERLGLEVTYWGDAVGEPLLAEAAREAPGQPVLFGPNLAPFQAPAVQMVSPSLAATETILVGWDASRPETAAGCRYGVVYRRRADLTSLDWLVEDGAVVSERRCRGVWVARLVRLPRRVPPRRMEPND